MIAPFINYQWDVDTANVKSFTKDNDGYAYILLAIDVFSRFIRTFPLKTTQAKETAAALNSLFGEGAKPKKLRTDKGVEYRNKVVDRLLKEEGVEHFVTQNELKSSFSERAIKNVKSKISRYMTRHQTHHWIDVLDSITQSYNETYHRSIKMAPRAVTKKDQSRLWKLQYGSRSKYVPQTRTRYSFKKGDIVRISHLRQPFAREYDERWTLEYFVFFAFHKRHSTGGAGDSGSPDPRDG